MWLKKLKESLCKLNLKKYIKIIGNIITVIALIFIAKRIYGMDINYSDIFNSEKVLYFVLIVILNVAAIFIVGVTWSFLIEIIIGRKFQNIKAMVVYVRANILKYVPGNVFHYVGRNSLAPKINASHADIALATVVDMLCTVIISAIVSLVFMKEAFFTYLFMFFDKFILFFLAIFFVLISLLVFLVYKFKSKIYNFIVEHRKILNKKSFLKFFGTLLMYIFNNIFSAVIYLIVMRVFLNYDFDFYSFCNVVGAFNLAWIVGFVVPGSPGGIGIRESVMTIIAGSLLNSDMIVLSMVIYRFVNILADVTSYIIAVFVNKKLNLKL